MVAPCWCRALFLKRWPWRQKCFCDKDEQQITRWQILLETQFSTRAPNEFFNHWSRKQIFPRNFKSSEKVKNLWITVPFVWDIRRFSTNLPTIFGGFVFTFYNQNIAIFVKEKVSWTFSIKTKSPTESSSKRAATPCPRTFHRTHQGRYSFGWDEKATLIFFEKTNMNLRHPNR